VSQSIPSDSNNTPGAAPTQETMSHSMAHYLLTIHKLKENRGYARVTDIAKDLGLTKGSVSTALNNLKKKGLIVEEDDSKFLLLTDSGHEEVHPLHRGQRFPVSRRVRPRKAQSYRQVLQ